MQEILLTVLGAAIVGKGPGAGQVAVDADVMQCMCMCMCMPPGDPPQPGRTPAMAPFPGFYPDLGPALWLPGLLTLVLAGRCKGAGLAPLGAQRGLNGWTRLG